MRNLHTALFTILLWMSFPWTGFSQSSDPPVNTTDAKQAYWAGIAHYDSTDWANAADWLRKATTADPQMQDAWYNLGLTYYQMQDYFETERYIEKVFAINPLYENAHALLGMALYHRGDYNRAINAFNFAINHKPTRELRLARAICHIAAGQPRFSLPDLDEILYEDPGHLRACLAKGAALIDLGQHKYALRFLNRILDNDPENTPALTNRAICFFQLGMKEEALEDFEQSIRLKPQLETFLSRARCHLSNGAFNNALADIKSALQIDSTSPALYYVLGQIEMGRSNYNSAMESFEIALDLDPSCMDCIMLKSEAQAHLNDFEAAVSDIYSILEKDPDNEQAREMLLWVYARMDKKRNVEK